MIKGPFAAVRPQGSFDPADGRWTVTIGVTGQHTIGVPLRAEVLNGVERAATKADLSVAVVIDELQETIEEGGAVAEGQIRAAIQRHRRGGYIFAGSKTRLLADMTSNLNRPFYKLGIVPYLGAVPRRFTVSLEESSQNGGIRVCRMPWRRSSMPQRTFPTTFKL